MFMEQQPNIQAAKMGADLEREHLDRQNTFNTRMVQLTNGQEGSNLTRSLEELRVTGKALRLTDEEMDNFIVAQGKQRAASGDTSFLMATQGIRNKDGVSLYDRDPSVKAAIISGQRMQLSLEQTDMADIKYGIEQRYMSGELSDADMISETANLNARYGGAAYSASEINSLRDTKVRADAKEGTVIRGDRKQLAQKLKLNPEDLGNQFQAYLQMNKQKFEDAAGGPKVDDMYFDIDQKRGVFQVRAGSSGIPVQGARPLSELGDYKWMRCGKPMRQAKLK
ncbi:hypothetical protein GH714_043928 [Hevea brasiliensis]|uniref:Uncharacterized protein n=1 Tax=Hevea brasiliensis TaxID=3981 RepID=A0A6A6K1E4_HEVBR|nr:hypothetical protein GH714_043928 [Hevea brasiliensis]